jgi:hypothetical protein
LLAPATDEADSWRLVSGSDAAPPALCREASGDVWRALPDVTASNLDVRLRARTAAGASEQYGVAFRQSDSGNYYLARVDTRNNNVRLYREQAGTLTLMAARDLGVSVGRWHELAIRAAGSHLAVALDGEPQLQVEDDHLRRGGIAIWVEPHSRVCFDRLWVRTIDTEGHGPLGLSANRE